jgi:hypothetical protein
VWQHSGRVEKKLLPGPPSMRALYGVGLLELEDLAGELGDLVVELCAATAQSLAPPHSLHAVY